MSAQPERLRLRLSMMLADLAIVIGSLVVAIVWYRLAGDRVWEHEFAMLALALTPATSIVFQLGGAYDELRSGRVRVLCGRSIWCFFLVVCLFLATAYLLKVSSHFSRTVIVSWIALSVIGLVSLRLAVDRYTRWRRTRGKDLQPTMLIGSARACAAMARHFADHPELGIVVRAMAGDGAVAKPGDDVVVCALDDVAETVMNRGIGRVIVCADANAHDLVLRAANALISCPVIVQYAPDLSSFPIFCLRVADFGGVPVINLSSSPLSERALLMKWLEDKVLATLFLVVASPLLLLIAVAIKLTSPGPVLFVQERHGRAGRVIRVFKFRTMHAPDAHTATRPALALTPALSTAAAGLADATRYLRADGGGSGPGVLARSAGDASPDDFVQAHRDDPRITPLGRILRRTSLDELPQFLNVLRGDMSLVGPRPHAIKHNRQFAVSIQDLMRRHYVKPGITGLAQINGARGETRSIGDMQRRIGFDLEYIQKWSFWLDLKILALTVVRGFYNNQP